MKSILGALTAAAVLVMSALTASWTGVAAQQPPPTLPAGEFVSPVRFVLTGPAQALSSNTIAYRLEYSPYTPPVGTATRGGGPVFVYGSPCMPPPSPCPPATFIGFRAVEGAVPLDLGPQAPGRSEAFALQGTSGTVDFLVKPKPGFTGTLGVGIYFTGTGIALPPGSQMVVRTLITAPAGSPVAPVTPLLPSTGLGGGPSQQFLAWLLAIGAVSLAVGGIAIVGAARAIRGR